MCCIENGFQRVIVTATKANRFAYKAATKPPSVRACDVTTGDNFFTGKLLCEAFENTTTLITKDIGVYCTLAQEDAATMESLLCRAVSKKVDFGRIIFARVGSGFDRPDANQTALETLSITVGVEPALENTYRAGVKVIQGILREWDTKGIPAPNDVGDILGALVEPGLIRSTRWGKGHSKGRRDVD